MINRFHFLKETGKRLRRFSRLNRILQGICIKKSILLLLALSVSCVTLTACEQHRTFGEKVRDTLDPPKGPIERAGRSVDRSLGN
ncbi:hypothetical protein GWK89_08835 [Gluconobacter kondonii]|nr:hypothetical protein [Gluconobacter kondonii]